MAGKMVEVIGSNPNVIPDVALDFAKRYGEDSNLPIIAITLEGSHSKALQNPQSDLDVVVHYFRPLKHLVCLNPPGLQQPAFVRDLEQAKKDGNATYNYKGFEVEVIPEPIYSVSETGNKLFPLLMKCNGKTVHDFYKDYPLWINPEYADRWAAFRTDMLEHFIPNLDAMSGYYIGYMKGQFCRWERRKDFNRRECQAISENDPTPMVKCVIAGLYIGFSACAMVDKRTVYRDFKALWNEYGFLLSQEENKFVLDTYFHKIRRHGVNIGSYIENADKHRENIYKKICEFVHLKTQGYLFPSKASRSNINLLNKHLRSFYGLEA